ncbi:MAG: ATP-binding cassette domain-containing protein [Bacteroidota bacterium]
MNHNNELPLVTDTILSFDNITIRNFNKVIFEKLNFALKAGEHWAIVGRSGSGKSVFLDALAGKTSFPSGVAAYPAFDEYIKASESDDPLFNRFKLISQVSSRHRFTNLSNTTDLYYQQRFNSMDSEDSPTVEQYLSEVKSYNTGGYWSFERSVTRLNLEPLLDKQLIKLSNGETKRLMLAAALIRNPILLLLDNPLTGLDISARADFNGLLHEIKSSGISIIMATSPGEVPDAITHVAVLGIGKIEEQLPRDLFKHEEYKALSPDLDTPELESLLSISEAPDYQVIVGMKDVTIKYGDKTILENLNWEITQGERWMLCGPNGAGKSTLLSLINGDNPQAFANNIILFDKKKGGGESIWEIKKKIGFVSPELFQYFPMESSCMHVIESGFYDTLGLFRRSNEDKASICLRWMHLLQIDTFAGSLFKNVSVSVQRLCLLARALIKNPPLLIFDEPCQGMDQEQQERFQYLVDEICKRSKVSLIYVSHYEAEKPNSVTRVLRLDNGREAR